MYSILYTHTQYHVRFLSQFLCRFREKKKKREILPFQIQTNMRRFLYSNAALLLKALCTEHLCISFIPSNEGKFYLLLCLTEQVKKLKKIALTLIPFLEHVYQCNVQ